MVAENARTNVQEMQRSCLHNIGLIQMQPVPLQLQYEANEGMNDTN
jgi:hypothetical protein